MNSLNQYLLSIRVVHISQMFSLVVLGLIITLSGPDRGAVLSESVNYLYLTGGITFMSWLLNRFVFPLQLKAIVKKEDLPKRFRAYRSYLLMRAAVISGSGFCSGVFYFIFPHWFFLGMMGLSLFQLASEWLSMTRLQHDLLLEGEELEQVLSRDFRC